MTFAHSNKLCAGLLVFTLWAGAASAHDEEPSRNALKRAAAVDVKAPEFVLIDQDNRRFDSAKLRGRVVVLNFIFTTCTDVCPLFTANLVQLQRRLNGPHGGELFFVSVTTDPEVDSPKVLKAYAQRHGADLTNWAFLTGSEGQLREVWKGFGITVIRKARGLVQHTSLTTVIDVKGVRRFNYLGEKWRTEKLEKDLLSLLRKP